MIMKSTGVKHMATSTFTGTAIDLYQAAVIKSALKLYARTGMKANRAYTPSNMMRMATIITGQKFKARDYHGAVAGLENWIESKRGEELTISATIK
jgi:hypothetical protein